MNRKLKTIVYSLLVLLLLYTLIWFKFTLGLSSIINQALSEQIHEIHDTHRIRFAKSSVTGFPFSVGVKIYNLTEDSVMASIEHEEPVSVVYNIISQKFVVSYSGKTKIRYKPFESKFGMDLTGNYEWSISSPLNMIVLKSLWNAKENFDLIGSIKGLAWRVTDLTVYDIVDNAKLMETKNIQVDIGVGHHKSYNNLEELKADIPKDFDISAHINTKYSASANAKPIPPSLVYGMLVPIDLQYNLSAHVHTDATNLDLKEIISKLQINVTNSDVHSDIQDYSTKMKFSSAVEATNMKYMLDYTSNILLKENYSKEFDKGVKSLLNIPPSVPYITVMRSFIRGLDLSSLDLNTQGDQIILTCKGDFTEQDKLFRLNLNRLGVRIKDVSFDIQNKSQADGALKDWTSEGVISLTQWQTIVNYLITSYYTVTQTPNIEPFGSVFHTKLINDFLIKIANDINDQYGAMTINYKFTNEIPTSQIGKFSVPEFSLLYYATLLKHITIALNDEAKALDQFKKMVPNYITEESSLNKIIQQSKG